MPANKPYAFENSKDFKSRMDKSNGDQVSKKNLKKSRAKGNPFSKAMKGK